MFNTFLTAAVRGRPGISPVAFMFFFGITIATVFSPNVSAFCFPPTNRNVPTKTRQFSNRNKIVPMHSIFPSSRNVNDDVNDGIGDTTHIVDELLELVEKKEEKPEEENLDENAIRNLITTLSSNANDNVLDEESPSSLFEPLVGYYNVSCTLTSRPNDNPVGGKWTRGLWTVKRTMQHILPPLSVTQLSDGVKDSSASEESVSVGSKAVAQVINAIRLEIFWGFVGVWVLLRGDAVPLKLDPAVTKSDDVTQKEDSKKKKSPPALLPDLSDRTVKAYFDRPKIGVSLRGRKGSKSLFKRVLTLGPTSAVVLDTPFADSRIRLGKGGTSGSQFVFSRLSETDEEAREGWKWVLEDKNSNFGRSLTKKGLVLRLGLLGLALGILSRVLQQRWMKVLAGAYAMFSSISIFGLLRSTGGIETEGDTYMKGKQ